MKGTVKSDIWTVLFAVEAEHTRAREKHGDNYHLRDMSYFQHAGYNAKFFQDWNDNGHAGWDTVLLEEVYEALEAENDEDRYNELIQVSAMAAGWAEAIKRRAAGPPPPERASDAESGRTTTR